MAMVIYKADGKFIGLMYQTIFEVGRLTTVDRQNLYSYLFQFQSH